MKLADELEPMIKYIINSDEYNDFKEYVEKTYKEDKIILVILLVVFLNLSKTTDWRPM